MQEFSHHLVSIGWRYGADGVQPEPVMRLRSMTDNSSDTIELIPGAELSMHLSADLFCPGYREFGLSYPCPEQRSPADGFEQCASCDRRSGFREAFLMRGAANASMQEYLRRPHYIYLAWFPPAIIKVGTAAEHRRHLRLIEQDALLALIVAQSDGFTIQDLEKATGRELGFTEAVSAVQKFRYINRPPDSAKGLQQLAMARRRMRLHFRESRFASWFLADDAVEEVNFTGNIHVRFPPRQTPIVKRNQPRVLSGRYQGLRGAFLLLEYEGKIVALNKRDIIGRRIRFADGPLPESYKDDTDSSLQPSLF